MGNGIAAPGGGKARRLYLLLKEEIARGAYPCGTALPGEEKLATSHEVSRVTVRRALDALDADGLIDRRRGRGTLVRERARSDTLSADFTTLMPQLIEMGQRTEVRLLSFDYVRPAPSVRRALGPLAGELVQRAVRVRALEGQPFSHLTTHVPEAIARDYCEDDLASTPLFRLLERSGVRIGTAEQSVTATLAPPEIARDLDVPEGSALLSIERLVRDDAGQGVEHLQAHYRPDLFRLDMTLSRKGTGGSRHWAPVIGARETME